MNPYQYFTGVALGALLEREGSTAFLNHQAELDPRQRGEHIRSICELAAAIGKAMEFNYKRGL